MRQLSARVAALMDLESCETVFLVRITDKNGVVIHADTTHYTEVILSNGFVYPPVGTLVSADPPQQSTTVDREQYRMTVADPDFEMAAQAEANLVGKRMEVRLAFIDPETGDPLEHIDDTFVIYAGAVNGGSLRVNMEEFGESLFQFDGVSPILSLEMRRGIYLSRDAVRQRNPSDSSCDQLYEGSGAVVMKWGKG